MADVYDEIEDVIRREKAAITQQLEGADAELDDAMADLRAAHKAVIEPLEQRETDLDGLLSQVEGLRAQNATPTPDPSAGADASTPTPEATSTPASSTDSSALPSSSGDLPSTPPSDDSSASPSSAASDPEPSSSTSSSGSPETSPIPIQSSGDAASLPPETPVTVSDSAGVEVVATAGDVVAAADPTVATDDLPEAAKPLRNSDFL